MQGRAEFDIIGNVGRIAEFSNTVKLNICSNYKSKDDRGNTVEHEYWNTVTVFTSNPTADFIKRYVRQGDLVAVRGKLRNAKYDKNGETIYTTNLVVDDLQQLVSKSRTASTADTPARVPVDDDIPF